MNKRLCAAVVAVVALTAGCAGEPAAAPPPSTTTTTTPPLPTPAELNERAKAAIAPPGAFDALGGKVKQSTPPNDGELGADGEVVTTICKTSELRVDGTSVARSRVWAGQVVLFQRVHAMSDRPAALLVKLAQDWVRSCAQYRPADQLKVDVPLTKPDGVDVVYSFCEANLDPELVPWSCQALLGRGTLITLVAAAGQTLVAAEAQLTAVLPTFAESFAKA